MNAPAYNPAAGGPAAIDAQPPSGEREAALVRAALIARLKSAHAMHAKVNAMNGSTRNGTLFGEAADMLATDAREQESLSKISDIRDSIIAAQKVDWSEHVYPLVAVLDAAGFPGIGYETAHKNLGTLIDRVRELEAMLAADAPEQEPARNLHGEIMNLPVGTGYAGLNINQRLAYKIGHRDARHAAAELAESIRSGGGGV